MSDTTEIINLQLGDIIQIESDDPTINNEIFVIKYLDSKRIVIVNIANLSEKTLIIDENGDLDAPISQISLLSRDPEAGYARQHGLLPDKWINIYFGGDLPTTITGQITNLEQDMIEVKTYPEQQVIYLDFGYKGIPEDLPIESIELREPPEKTKEKEASPDVTEEQELLDEIGTPVSLEVPTSDIKSQIQEMFISADEIEFGPELEAITQVIQVDKEKQRFGIDNQTTDLLDELLATIPNSQRTQSVLNNLHLIIERYKQLRNAFSEFDNYGNALLPTTKGANFKPLVKSLKTLNKKLYWLLPIAKNRKNLYDVDQDEAEEYNDINSLTLAQSQVKTTTGISNYYDNTIPNEENKYHYLVNLINQETQPFTRPSYSGELSDLDSGLDAIISNFEVNANLNVAIDNLEDFYCSVAHNDSVKRKRFLISKYNLGLTGLKPTELTGSKMLADTIKLTPNNTIYLKSMLMLSEPFVRYSHISLPATNILKKADLNRIPFYYFDKLRQKTFVNVKPVDNEDDKIEFDPATFLNGFTEFAPNTGFSTNSYDEYLNEMVPKTKVIFQLMKKYITGKLSLYDVVGQLEPFLIYTDDLTFQQYAEMMKFISHKILDYKKNYVSSQREFRKLLGRGVNPRSIHHTIYSLLEGKNNPTDYTSLQNTILAAYKIMDETLGDRQRIIYSSSEILNMINKTDYGDYFNSGVAISNLPLVSALDINEEFEESKANVNSTIEQEKMANQCKNYVLAKKYIAIDELQDDNNQPEIFFDKNLDPTRYEISNEYQSDIVGQDMTGPEAVDFIKTKLMESNGLGEAEALRDASAMFLKKRAIIDGEYAVLVTEEDGKTQYRYYKRQDLMWERDESIPSVDYKDQKAFCNIQEKCFDINDKCADINLAESQLKKESLNEVIREFDIKYEVSKQDLERVLSTKFTYQKYALHEIEKIKKLQSLKHNAIQLKMGSTLEDEDIVVSPHAKIRDLVLGQSDFVKKQSNIIQFCTRFTRGAGLSTTDAKGEDEYWRYCVDTNTKLLPQFILSLAKVFLENGNYQAELDRICSTQGKISDDGEAWVDEHSGYVIKLIEFSTEEGYDDSGYKMQSRETLQQDLADVNVSADDEPDIMADPNAQMVNNVVTALATYMGINIESKRQFIIRNALLNNIQKVDSREDYEKRAAAILKSKNKRLPKYEFVFNNSLLLFTLAYFHVGVQVMVPSVKTRKRFPGCVKSFDGFPLEGTTNFDGLTYVVCVANKIKSSVSPWDTIKKNNESTILKRVKDIISKVVLNNEQVVRAIKEKLEFNALNIGDEVPIDLDIMKWNTFLPPLRPVKIVGLENVSDVFKESLLSNIKSGSKKQIEQIRVLKGKVLYFALKIQQDIQLVLDKEKPLLSNAANEPFLENACCHDTFSTTMDYFIDKNKNIKIHNDIVSNLSKIVYDVDNITQAVRIFDPRDTRLKYPKLANDFSETTIYRCFIKFCRFGSILPIPEKIAPLCLAKPENFNTFNDIDEQVRVLKRDGKIFTTESLNSLLAIINGENIIEGNLYPVIPDNVQSIRDLLTHFTDSDDRSIPSEFKDKLYNLIDTYDIAITQDTAAMRDFKNYMATKNAELRSEIISFLKQNSNTSTGKFKPIEEFINTFAIWEDISLPNPSSNVEEQGVFRVLNFISDCVFNICRVFPNIILNKVNYKQLNIPRHWKLSERHMNDIKKIISGYYAGLLKYYDKESLDYVLNNIQIVTKNIYLVMKNIPCFSSVIKNQTKYYSIFNKDVTKLIFEFSMLEVYKHFIKLSEGLEIDLRPVPSSEQTMITNVQLEDADIGNITELEIVQGERLHVQQEVAALLIDITNIFISTKKTLNYGYDDIMNRVNRAKEREKDEVTTRLKELTDEEREIDTLFKNHKLGTWSKGLQKGLTQYVKGTYDEERDALDKRAMTEAKVGEFSFVTEMNREIYTMDYDEQQMQDQAIEAEVNDLSMYVGEEDDYGDNDGDEGY